MLPAGCLDTTYSKRSSWNWQPKKRRTFSWREKERYIVIYSEHWIAFWWFNNDEEYYFVNKFSDDSYGYLYISIIKHTFRNWEVAIEMNISFIIMMIFLGGRVRPFHVIMTNTIKTFYWLGDASRIMIYLSTLKLDIWLLIFFFGFGPRNVPIHPKQTPWRHSKDYWVTIGTLRSLRLMEILSFSSYTLDV